MTTGISPSDVVADRYEIRDRIGRGAFGEVFEAYDERLGRLVALKTLPIEAVASAEATEDLRRFHLEAKAVARLAHPGIVTVHDFGETESYAWIVMELVIGESLKAVLDRGERVSLSETVRVVGALLDALGYAHGRGIVHRDVKPANIMLAMTAGDGLGEVRLTDFGLARMGEPQHTVVGQVLGTPTAMSPEQVRGEEADARSDIWAAGVVLYQMLTGRRPFLGGMPIIFQNILNHQPDPPSELVPELPPELDAIVARALAKKKADRYASAAEMAAELRLAATARRLPEILAAEDATVVMALHRPAEPPAPSPLAPAPAGRAWSLPPVAKRLSARAGVFGAGLLVGLMLNRLPDWDILGAASAAVSAFVTHLDEGAGRQPADPTAPPKPAPPSAEPAASPAAQQLPKADPPPPEDARPQDPPVPEPPAPEQATELQERPAAAREEPTASVALAGSATSPEAPPPSPDPPADPPATPPLPAEASARGALGPCGPDRLATRAASHPGFGRLVFEWRAPTRHDFRLAGQGAVLGFPEAGCLPSLQHLALPRNIRAIRPNAAGTALRIETLPGAGIRLYRLNGNRLVLDVHDAAG